MRRTVIADYGQWLAITENEEGDVYVEILQFPSEEWEQEWEESS